MKTSDLVAAIATDAGEDLAASCGVTPESTPDEATAILAAVLVAVADELDARIPPRSK